VETTVAAASAMTVAQYRRDIGNQRRHTLYRHFPDERALLLACSGQYTSQNPMPDPTAWVVIGDPVERLRRGLTELYELL
jgi:hypothetical protein